MSDLDFRNILEIPTTLRVVSDCWQNAEQSLQADIREDYPGVNEEFITQMFHGKLAKALRAASSNHLIERAFLTDLGNTFCDLRDDFELSRIAQGLIANVTLHKRDTEIVTGGDIGFIIIRPQIEDAGYALRVSDYRRGILCQAKIKRADGKWGNFSRTQNKVLPERLQYFALLLYSYEDEERRMLKQFQWQLCDSASSIKEVAKWLRRESFPSLISSEAVIVGVGDGLIGTDDDELLDEIVAPIGNPALVITIGWPDDDHPGSQIFVYSRQHHEEQIKAYAYIRSGY
jgi:hypothetical protein